LPIAKGTIKEIDLLRHQIKLTTEDGVRMSPYTSRTYIFRDKEKIIADNLKVGEVMPCASARTRRQCGCWHKSPYAIRTHGAAAVAPAATGM